MIDRRRFLSTAATFTMLMSAAPALAYAVRPNLDEAFARLSFAAQTMRHNGMDYAAIAKRCKHMRSMNGVFVAPDYEDSLLRAARKLENEGAERQTIKKALLRLEQTITPQGFWSNAPSGAGFHEAIKSLRG